VATNDRDKVVDSLEFIKPNMFEKKNAENKRIKEALLENSLEDMYYVSEGYLGNALNVVGKEP
jgi:RNA binding exosome subunit